MGVSIRNPTIGGAAVKPTTVVRADSPDSGGVAVAHNAGVSVPTGLPGADGNSTIEIFEYQMSIPATTVTLDHGLGRDPIFVQVFVDGALVDEYGVFITIPGVQVQVGFDIAITAFIRVL